MEEWALVYFQEEDCYCSIPRDHIVAGDYEEKKKVKVKWAHYDAINNTDTEDIYDATVIKIGMGTWSNLGRARLEKNSGTFRHLGALLPITKVVGAFTEDSTVNRRTKKIVNQAEVQNVMKLKEARQRQKLNGPRERKPSARKLGYTGGSSPVKTSNVKKTRGQSTKKRPASTSPPMETTVPKAKRKSQNNATAAKKPNKGVTREVLHGRSKAKSEANKAKNEANKAKTAARNSEAAAYFAHKFSGNGRSPVASQTQSERPSIPPTTIHQTSLTPPPQQTSTCINRQQASPPTTMHQTSLTPPPRQTSMGINRQQPSPQTTMHQTSLTPPPQQTSMGINRQRPSPQTTMHQTSLTPPPQQTSTGINRQQPSPQTTMHQTSLTPPPQQTSKGINRLQASPQTTMHQTSLTPPPQQTSMGINRQRPSPQTTMHQTSLTPPPQQTSAGINRQQPSPPTTIHQTPLTPPSQQTSTDINRQPTSLLQSLSPTFSGSGQRHMQQQSSGYQVSAHSTTSHASKYTGTTLSPASSSTPSHVDTQYGMDDHIFDTWQHTPNNSSDDDDIEMSTSHIFGMAMSTVNETLRDDDNPMSFPFSNANGSGGTCTSTSPSILNMDDGKQSQPTGVTECQNCAIYKDEITRLKTQTLVPVPSPEAAEYIKQLFLVLCGMKIGEQGTNNNHRTQSMDQTSDDTCYKKPGQGMTQLVPNEPVYMSAIVLTSILSECKKDAKKLFHKLIEYYFPVAVLAVSTGSDVKQSSAGKVPLDQSIVKTLKSYARAAAFKNNENVTDRDLNRILTNKCTAAKRSIGKKLKEYKRMDDNNEKSNYM
ncbi:uncharacterized protein LOC144445756 [Glandiceps talaboti]